MKISHEQNNKIKTDGIQSNNNVLHAKITNHIYKWHLTHKLS